MMIFVIAVVSIACVFLALSLCAPADDAASVSFSMTFRALGSEYRNGQAAARRYDRLLAEGAAPERAAEEIFRSHYRSRHIRPRPVTESKSREPVSAGRIQHG